MLTELACKSAKASEKPRKLTDGAGLYLFVAPTGLKSWRMRYRFLGREKKLTFGKYPELSLRAARGKRDQARALLREGLDPAREKRRLVQEAATAAANEFQIVAHQWLCSKKHRWNPRYAKRVTERLANATRKFARTPIEQITAMQMIELITSIQNRGAGSMAMRVLQICSSVFAYAIATGRARTNPAEEIRAAVTGPVKSRRPAVIDISAAKAVLEQIESSSPIASSVIMASRLTALTAQRPGVVRLAEKKEFKNLDGPEPVWRIPASKMKLNIEQKADSAFDFFVPLSHQSASLVQSAIARSESPDWLFPGQFGWRKPFNENGLSDLYRDCGLQGKQVPHGWRATFSTIMNEWSALAGSEKDRAIIDLMLAHFPDNVEAAYNRASYMPRRRELAQLWADMLLADMPELPAPPA